jgi:DNA-binding CsgD family transcriptional regulator
MNKTTTINKKLHLFVSFTIVLFFIEDLIVDIMSLTEVGFHFYFEFFAVSVLIYLLVAQSYEIYSANKKLNIANKKLIVLKQDLFSAINEQLNAWKLSKAEKEVAWLVLKGFSFSKVSELRGVSKKTVHQQISNVYKKSNSKNRHEFMSGFLEDFMNVDE